MPLWPRWRARYRVSQLRSVSRLPVLIEGLNASSIFRLTRVTRIFRKKIFTETTPETTPAPGRHAAPGFLLREPRVRPRAAGFSCLQKKQGNTGDQSHAVSKKAKAGIRPDGRAGSSIGRPKGPGGTQGTSRAARRSRTLTGVLPVGRPGTNAGAPYAGLTHACHAVS